MLPFLHGKGPYVQSSEHQKAKWHLYSEVTQHCSFLESLDRRRTLSPLRGEVKVER